MTDEPLSSVPTDRRLPAEPIWSKQTLAATATLAVIIALADLLFYPHEPGISFALFFAALTTAVAALYPRRVSDPRTLAMGAVALLSALPFVESENWLWLPFALGAVSLFTLEAAGHLGRFEDWLGSVVRFAVLSPVRLLVDAVMLLGEAGRQKFGGRLVRLGLVWIVPVACAAIFAWLFVAANPVLEDGFHAIRLETLFQFLDPRRVFIWGVVAAVAWPVLAPRLLRWETVGAWQGPLQPKPESLIFGAVAIRNSLMVFNALFAVQTAMDFVFLWGGVRLPDNLTYADYAHRGAYPLIVTAVLAGAFALAAMRRNGPGEKSQLIRTLVYLWIIQNVWLVISSILRLKLYVEAYGLSELRIAAGVWMGLVAVGLVLIVAKIALDCSNRWLVMANLTALMLTLWGVSFLNFPAVIASFNVDHSYEMTGSGMQLDDFYMESLGPEVIPALDRYLVNAKFSDADKLKEVGLIRDGLADQVVDRDAVGKADLWRLDWQSWTWRQERLRQYVKGQVFAPEQRAAIN